MDELIKMVIKTKTHIIFMIAIVIVVVSSFVIHFLEPQTFPTLFESFWWVMTTVTTVGYGDLAPVTVAGRYYAIFLYLFGIGLIGLVIGKIVNSYSTYYKMKGEGKLRYLGKGHIVIIGWSLRAKKTIEEILYYHDKIEIVLIEQFPETPFEHERVRYIQGDPASRDTLKRANICEALSVCIFSTAHGKDSSEMDGKTLLIASAIELYSNEIGKDIYTIAEIVKEKHIPNFRYANIDEYVLSNEAFSDLMAKSAIHKGTAKLLMHLLNRRNKDDIYEIKKKKEWKTYNDAFEELKKIGAILVSDHQGFGIIRRLHEPIEEETKLYVICDEKTYQEIVRQTSPS